VVRARTVAAGGDVPGAKRLLDGVLARGPADEDALMLRAELLFATQQTDAALAAVREVLAVRANHLQAHAVLLGHHLLQSDLDAAARQLAALRKVRPKHPQTVYFEARLAAQRGDLAAADEGIKQLLKAGSQSAQVLHLAGVVALQRGELEQADLYFGKVLQQFPQSAGVRHMQARVAMRRGDPGRVLVILEPLLRAARSDATTLTLAAAAHAQHGDMRAAEEFFARALKADPDDPGLRTDLARTRLARGDASALVELEAVAASDPGDTADMPLIAAAVNRRDFDAARRAADRLVDKQPDKAPAHVLRAQVRQAQGDHAQARAGFERALAIDAGHFPALAGLVDLDLREGKPDAARARLLQFLESHPKSAQGHGALAELDWRAGRPAAQIVASFVKAIAADPNDARPRARLVDFHLSRHDTSAAMAAAQAGASVAPNDPAMLERLARAQLAAGSAQQALVTFNRLATLVPRSPTPLMGVADAQLALGNAGGALHAARRAHAIAPDDAAVNRKLVVTLLAAQQAAAALDAAQSAARRVPTASWGDELLGDVYRAQGKNKEAAASYRSSLRKQPASAAAMKLHLVLLASGAGEPAAAHVQAWLRERPRDADFLVHLGLLASTHGDHAQAEGHYRQALAIEPGNVLALNNLASTLRELKKPGARQFAERANELLPNEPAFIDTLAWTLADDGQLKQAIELQVAAVARFGHVPKLRLSLAKLYLRRNEADKARTELEKLKELGSGFSGHAEVEQLLKPR
jgi:cellulose synthase operon protein C